MKRIKTFAKWTLGALAIAAFSTVGLLRAQPSAEQPKPAVARALLAPPQPNQPRPDSAPTTPALPVPRSPVAAPQPKAVEFVPANAQQAVSYLTGIANYGRAAPDDPELAALKQSDAALAQQSAQLIGQYAATVVAEERSAIKTQLAEILARHFDVQQQMRERELARVEARIKKLRELTQKRREAQQTIVQQRLDQLLREADGLGWTPPENSLSTNSVSTVPFVRSGIGLPAPAYSAGVGAGAAIVVPTSKD